VLTYPLPVTNTEVSYTYTLLCLQSLILLGPDSRYEADISDLSLVLEIAVLLHPWLLHWEVRLYSGTADASIALTIAVHAWVWSAAGFHGSHLPGSHSILALL
jgi:hypothetical protein